MTIKDLKKLQKMLDVQGVSYDIEVNFRHSFGRDGRCPYGDIDAALEAAKNYVLEKSEGGSFAAVDILLYKSDIKTGWWLVGQTTVKPEHSGKYYGNGYAIPVPNTIEVK